MTVEIHPNPPSSSRRAARGRRRPQQCDRSDQPKHVHPTGIGPSAAEPKADRSTRTARLKEGLRIVNASLAGGIVGGILVAGFGGRLLMRVIAATSDSRAQGRLTEADQVIGDVSADGTIFLVVFVGVVAGLLIAGILGGILARPSDLLNPDSIDFEILGPKWLAALMIITLVALFGATSGALIDTFVRIWPQPAWTRAVESARCWSLVGWF